MKAKTIYWVTNFSAPYRRPVWAHLSTEIDVNLCLIDGRTSADGAVRGDEWFDCIEDRNFATLALVTKTLTLKGHHFIFLAPTALAQFKGAHALVLGGWEHPAYWQLLVYAWLTRTPTVGFYESTEDDQRFHTGPIARARSLYLRSLTTLVVPGTRSERAALVAGVELSRIHRGFNAVDVSSFVAASEKRQDRQREENHSSGGHRFIYVGQMIKRKNVKELIEAFASVRRSGDILTLVGSGPEIDELRCYSTSLGLAESVDFRGSLAYGEIPNVIAGHHTLVLPSLQEVWGLVANEALAAGLHCIVSSKAGVSPEIEDMPGVFIFNPQRGELVPALNRSRTTWRGWILEPPILNHSPERFASTFKPAIEQAISYRWRRRRI